MDTAAQAATVVWWAALGIGLVVTLVVALLLREIHATATRIEALVSRIWDTGQRVANNTIHIPILHRINRRVARILDTARGIAEGAAAIRAHADGCPGCPHCMLEHRR